MTNDKVLQQLTDYKTTISLIEKTGWNTTKKQILRKNEFGLCRERKV